MKPLLKDIYSKLDRATFPLSPRARVMGVVLSFFSPAFNRGGSRGLRCLIKGEDLSERSECEVSSTASSRFPGTAKPAVELAGNNNKSLFPPFLSIHRKGVAGARAAPAKPPFSNGAI